MLQFLSEIDAGELAVELLNDYVYFRLFFEGVGKPRKMKPMFGSLEDPVKPVEMLNRSRKGVSSLCFALRSNTAPKAPAGWLLEDDVHLPKFNELVKKNVSSGYSLSLVIPKSNKI